MKAPTLFDYNEVNAYMGIALATAGHTFYFLAFEIVGKTVVKFHEMHYEQLRESERHTYEKKSFVYR